IHTVKGASSFLGFDLLVKVTHKTEDVLNRLRKGEVQVTPEIMDVVLEATDLVKILVSDIKAGEIQEREIDGTISKLLPYLTQEAAPAPAPPAESTVEPIKAPAAPAAEPAVPPPAATEPELP